MNTFDLSNGKDIQPFQYHPSLALDGPFYVRASESVAAGHPDKVCDQISDALVDAYLHQNPHAHTAIETLVTKDQVVLAGEIQGASLSADDVDAIVRKTICAIGYDAQGFSYKTVQIHNVLHAQSQDIARGVGTGHDVSDVGAGDQGLMFGYACHETPDFMPAPLYYAHTLLQKLHHMRQGAWLGQLGPDAKSQVIMRYVDDVPIGIDAVVLSTQHHEDLSHDDVNDMIVPMVEDTLPEHWRDSLGPIYINPTGRFVTGGPVADTGLTGRKIIVDTYGGAAPHGGGAFSGKDPTKVDRSAAYMMRYLAKNIVASGICTRCTLEVSYVIGRTQPLSLYAHTHGTSHIHEHDIVKTIHKHFDLSPRGIRNHLNLNRPIYAPTATFGHFGRAYQSETGHFSWENLDAVPIFEELLTKKG